MNYRLLSWDSDFFQYPVAQLEYSESLCDAKEEILAKLKEDAVHLLHIVISDFEKHSPAFNDRGHNFITQQLGAALVDEKVTFSMPVGRSNNYEQVEHITEFSGTDVNSLYELAYVSGEYSRYRTDARFQHDEFGRLYRAWIDNALNNVDAERIFVYQHADTILGMITLKLHMPHCVIGLFAVNPHWRGKAIGTKLITFALNYCRKNEYTELKVATQRANSGALRFYEKNGFMHESTKRIYHLWVD